MNKLRRSDVIRFYKNNKNYFDHMDAFHDANYYESVLRFLRECGLGLNGKKILDIGCGSGTLIRVLKEKYKHVDVYGIDVSKLGKPSRYLKFKISSAEDIPFKKESFDLILIVDVLEHVMSPEKVLFEAKRVLRKNGFIILRTPNYLSPLLGQISLKKLAANIDLYYKNESLGLPNILRLKPDLSENVIGGDLDAVTGICYTDLLYGVKKMGLTVCKSESWGGGPSSSPVIRLLNLFPIIGLLGTSSTLVCRK